MTKLISNELGGKFWRMDVCYFDTCCCVVSSWAIMCVFPILKEIIIKKLFTEVNKTFDSSIWDH